MQYTRNCIYAALVTVCNSCVYLNVYSHICEKRRLDSSFPSFPSSWNSFHWRDFPEILYSKFTQISRECSSIVSNWTKGRQRTY